LLSMERSLCQFDFEVSHSFEGCRTGRELAS
jgi:hypothetical protein